MHSECGEAPRSTASPYIWRLLEAPPTAALQETERKPLVTRMDWSPSAWRSASSFHMLLSALALAVPAATFPPAQVLLHLFSSGYVKWAGVQSLSWSA